MTHTIIIDDKAKAKDSARMGYNFRGKQVFYDPQREYKAATSDYIYYTKQYPKEPFKGPLGLDLYVLRPIPRSYTKKRQRDYLEGKFAWQVKIDLDNIVKLYQDILNFGELNGRIFSDDSTISKERLIKLWTPNSPKIVINIEELNPANLQIPSVVQQLLISP